MKKTMHVPTLWILLLAALLAGACGAPEAPPPATTEVAAEVAVEPNWTSLVPHARQPIAGVITGGQPSLDQLRRARDAGVTTVIDLRTATEERLDPQAVEALGLRHVSIPVAGSDGVTEANARAMADALTGVEEGRTIVYCGSGNRVGALFALKALHVDGLGPEEALAAGRAAGLTRLEPFVRDYLNLPAEAQ